MTGLATLKRFEAALDKERQALLSGDFGMLAALAAERDGLLDGLAVGGHDRARLGALRDKALRNAELARAAREGMHAALSRLASIRNAAGPIGSYSADGSRSEIGSARPDFERKA